MWKCIQLLCTVIRMGGDTARFHSPLPATTVPFRIVWHSFEERLEKSRGASQGPREKWGGVSYTSRRCAEKEKDHDAGCCPVLGLPSWGDHRDHRMPLLGRDNKEHLVPTLLLWGGLPTTKWGTRCCQKTGSSAKVLEQGDPNSQQCVLSWGESADFSGSEVVHMLCKMGSLMGLWRYTLNLLKPMKRAQD